MLSYEDLPIIWTGEPVEELEISLDEMEENNGTQTEQC